MRYRIEHRTNYRYARTAVSTQQLLRFRRAVTLTSGWQWDGARAGSLSVATDAYRNQTHMHTMIVARQPPHRGLR